MSVGSVKRRRFGGDEKLSNTNITTRSATLIGSGALILWAIEPLVVSELEGFPLFEALTLVFTSCFVFTAIRVTLARKWAIILKQPLFVWLFGLATICGSDFCYMLGAFSAPIAHVDLIDYLWPCMIVLFIGFLPNEKFSFRHLIGALLGFIGIGQLVCGGEMNGFNMNYLNGYLLAIYGVMIWGAYSVFSRHRTEVPSDMVGIYCGVGAVLTFIGHCQFETTVIPDFHQGTMAVLLGLAGPGLAYQLWEYGIKFGDAKWLSVACYFARVTAMALLVYFGKEPYSTELVIACTLAIVGVFITSIDEKWFKLLRPRLPKKLRRRNLLVSSNDTLSTGAYEPEAA